MTDDMVKRDHRPTGSKELQATMMMALNSAKRLAQQASATGIDAGIETMPRMIGQHCIPMNVMVVRNG